MQIIQTSGLTKNFGKTRAVDMVTIHVREGEIYGFLGLNGAGKTTTIRLLLGMIRPDSGSIRLFGKTLKQGGEIWNDIGYLVETPYSYPDLTVAENLEVVFRLRGLAGKEKIEDIIRRLQLENYRDIKFRHLSMGNKQRLGLAKALIHSPRLLILDEPINGLDPAGIAEIRLFLKDLAENQNTTIFLSSHILSEISKLATRIGIVHRGQLIKEIDTNDLGNQIIKKLQVQTHNNIEALKILNKAGYNFVTGKDNYIETSDRSAMEKPEQIAIILVKNNLPPGSLFRLEEDLETYFLRIIAG